METKDDNNFLWGIVICVVALFLFYFVTKPQVVDSSKS